MKTFFLELHETVKLWRLIHLIGVSALRARYARSVLGQTWLSLTTLVFIVSVGSIWSLIWGVPIDAYLPYIGVGHIVYTYAAQTINESTGVLVADSRFYLNEKLSFQTSVAAHIYRTTIVLAHNIPTVALLIIWSDSATFDPNISLLFGALFTLFFVYASSYGISLICTRFRDLIQIIALIMQISFLLTPVMWNPEMLDASIRHWIYLNPFSSILELIRNPLIGAPVNPMAYASLSAWTLLSFCCAILASRIFGRRLVFWM